MKKLSALSLLALLVLVAASCANAPIPSPSVPGYPCGVMGVPCGNHMCCDQGQACGIPHTASEGMCPFVGDEGGFGAKQPAKQWPEITPSS